MCTYVYKVCADPAVCGVPPAYALTRLQVFNGTTQDVEFTIEFDQLESWIKDVQKIFQMDLWENGKARCVCVCAAAYAYLCPYTAGLCVCCTLHSLLAGMRDCRAPLCTPACYLQHCSRA